MSESDLLFFKVAAGAAALAWLLLAGMLAYAAWSLARAFKRIETRIDEMRAGLEAPLGDLRMALADLRDVCGIGRDAASRGYNALMGLKRVGLRGVGALLGRLGAVLRPQS